MKERKTKSKFLIIMLTCMIALSSVWAGRTFAYFNASNNASGTITMGTLKVNNFGELDAETSLKVVPNQTVTKNFKATIESDIKYYKRLSLSATVDVATGKTHDSTCGDYVADDTKILNATVQGFEKYTADDDSIYYYSLAPVTPTNTTTEENFTVNLAIHDWVGSGGCDYYMGATINIGVKIGVIQADYLESDTTGTTYSSADELHNVWTDCMPKPYTVTLSGYGLYYAVDGEDELHYKASGVSMDLETNERIFVLFCGSMEQPEWSIEENVLLGTVTTRYGVYEIYEPIDIQTQSLSLVNQEVTGSIPLQKDDLPIVSVSGPGDFVIEINNKHVFSYPYDPDICYAIITITNDTIIERVNTG